MGGGAQLISNDVSAVKTWIDLGKPATLHIVLKGDVTVSFPLSRIRSFRRRAAFRGLLEDGAAALRDVCVADFGHTIEWPGLGLDFSIAEMLPELLGIHTVAAAGRSGGRKKTPAKMAASRSNGAKGGRPRKSTAA